MIANVFQGLFDDAQWLINQYTYSLSVESLHDFTYKDITGVIDKHQYRAVLREKHVGQGRRANTISH